MEDPDVLEAFYLYVKDKQWGYLARHGYTPRCLIQELHYPPYEAYCIMIQLQSDTERTITMLKHRANEPQLTKSKTFNINKPWEEYQVVRYKKFLYSDVFFPRGDAV